MDKWFKYLLERKVGIAATTEGIGVGRRGCRCSLCCGSLLSRGEGSGGSTCKGNVHASRRCCGGSCCYGSLGLPGTNLIVPTSLILVCINVERNGVALTSLNVELLDAIRSEHLETHLARILFHGLKYVSCTSPLCTRTCRNTTALRQYCDNLSCNFHYVILLKFQNSMQRYNSFLS